MRRAVLVFGVYPPTPGPAAATTVETVRGLLAEGHDVQVVSPLPSAAHSHADVRGLRGTVRLAALVARARPQRMVVHLDPVVLHRQPGAGRRMQAARQLLGRALRGATVHVASPVGPLDPELVRLVLSRTGKVTAATADDRQALITAGLPATLVRGLEAPSPTGGPGGTVAGPAREPWPADGGDRETLEAEIRRRAARDRGAEALPDPALVGTTLTPSGLPLRSISPLSAAPTGSHRVAARVVKQVVRRFTAWELNPLIDHVNLLHRAVTEALDAVERRPSEAPAAQPPPPSAS